MKSYIRNIVFTCPDAPALGNFYAELLGMRVIRRDWFVIANDEYSSPRLAFDEEREYRPPRWPRPGHQEIGMTMMRVATVSAFLLVLVSGIALQASASTVTDPKALTLKLSDLPIHFKVTLSKYGNLHNTPKSIVKHGIVRSYDTEFQRSTVPGMIIVINDVASFKDVAGAKFSLGKLVSYFKGSVKNKYKISQLSAPGFGEQSIAFRVSARSGGYSFVGAIIGLRVKRYGSLVMCLGLKSGFSPSGCYSVARVSARHLAAGV